MTIDRQPRHGDAHAPRHGRRRAGRVHRRGAPHRRATGRPLRAGRRRAVVRSPEKAIRSASGSGLDPSGLSATTRTMARRRPRATDGIEAVAIVTPNHLHAPVADAFLEAGIHVICDKPLTTTPRRRDACAQGRRAAA